MALLLTGVEAAFLLCLLVLAVPVLVLALQVTAAPRAGRGRPAPPCTRRAPALLVPAHNEGGRIGATLASPRAQPRRGDRLLVAADNCSDDTAVLAHLGGAEVAIRSDPIRRCKGHARAFGIRQPDAAPPKVVIALDAGCRREPGAVKALARTRAASTRPVQTACVAPARGGAPPGNQAAAQFARTVTHRLGPLGWQRLGFGCQPRGGGVALAWALARSAPLAGARIAEGPRLGLELALAGAAPRYCPQATVTGRFAEHSVGASRTSTHCERGQLALIARYAPRMRRQSLARRDLRPFALALDLCVPPPGLLLMLASLLGLGGALAWALSGRLLPWTLAPLLPPLLATAFGLAWHKAGRDKLRARQPGHALLHAMARIALYLRLPQRRQRQSMSPARDEPRPR